MNNTKIEKINQVLADYFEKNKSMNRVPAKDMMDYFVGAGIFKEDRKNGYPIRKLLRELDEKNELHLIPYVVAERKIANTNWFFQRR